MYTNMLVRSCGAGAAILGADAPEPSAPEPSYIYIYIDR